METKWHWHLRNSPSVKHDIKRRREKKWRPPPSFLPAIFYMMCSTHPNAHTQLALVLIGTAVGLLFQSSLTKMSAAFRIENDCC